MAGAALLVSMPIVGVVCALAARCLLPVSPDAADGARLKFARPLSGLMVGMMLIAAATFAAARVVRNLAFGGWNTC